MRAHPGIGNAVECCPGRSQQPIHGHAPVKALTELRLSLSGFEGKQGYAFTHKVNYANGLQGENGH